MEQPIKVTCNGITTCTCPHCFTEIKNMEHSLLWGDQKIIPCEHCKQEILWKNGISIAFGL